LIARVSGICCRPFGLRHGQPGLHVGASGLFSGGGQLSLLFNGFLGGGLFFRLFLELLRDIF